MASRVSSPTFVGRRDELDRATAGMDRARKGQPAVFLIAGEAGVGKTRFVAELAARARNAGFRVLSGGCIQLGGEGLGFGAVTEALRGLAHDLPPAELDALVGSGRNELARLMPDLAIASRPAEASGSADASAPGRLLEHLLRFLERLAERAPVMLVLEDLHWADRSTLELFGFLVRNVLHSPIVLLATYRTDELHRRHPLLPFLAELERAGPAERLELRRFDRDELARQLEGILGGIPDPELVGRVLARSEGNAFYAEELLAAGGDRGPLPATLRDLLLVRVAALSEPTQELLRIASAAGQRIAPAILGRVSGVDGPAVTAALREAVVRQILQPLEGGMDDRYVFRHALVQEAVYGDLLPGERASLHGAFARALTENERLASDASMAAELAYHWHAAHDLPRAFEASIAAGIAAETAYAFAEAHAHFDRALELWDQIPDAKDRSPLDRVEVLRHTAATAEHEDPARSAAYIRRAIDLVDAVADPWRAGLLYERLGDYTAEIPDAARGLAAFREAVRLVPAEPPTAARAVVLSSLGRYLSLLEDAVASTPFCEEALAIARAVGDRSTESQTLLALGGNQIGLGDIEGGLATMAHAREVATTLGDVFTTARALTWSTGAFLTALKHDETIAAGLAADAFAVEHGMAARFGTTDLLYASYALWYLGRWDEAVDHLARAHAYGGLVELVIDEGLMFLEALRGDFASANRRAALVRPLAGNPTAGINAEAVAELALWQGDPLTARAAISADLPMLDSRPEVTVFLLGWACFLGTRAEADIAVQARSAHWEPELNEARDIGQDRLTRARALAGEVARRRPYYSALAAAWLANCEGEWSRLNGGVDPALWASAANAWQALRMPYYRAYALMREGEASLAGGNDRRHALDVLTEARGIAARLGADPLRIAIDDLGARAVGQAARRTSPANIEAAEAGSAQDHARRATARIPRDRTGVRIGLTTRERDVLSLLAAGRSDAEIAQALFITKNTASSHVAHIKDKLEAANRVEIAVIAIGLGLVDAPSASA